MQSLDLESLIDYDEEVLDILANPWLADMHCAVEPDSDDADFFVETANQQPVESVNWTKEGF